MTVWYLRIFIVVGLFFSLHSVGAAPLVVENAGFPKATIWYSHEPFYAGDTVQISTVVVNSSKQSLSGNVSFYVNDDMIGKRSFVLDPEGDTVLLGVPWVAKKGLVTIRAEITDTFTGFGTLREEVTLTTSETGRDERTIEERPVARKESGALTLGEKIIHVIPDPIKETSVHVASKLEEKRYEASTASELKLAETNAEIEARGVMLPKDGQKPSALQKPWLIAKKGIFWALHRFTDSKIIFYSVGSVLALFVLRFLYRLVRRRSAPAAFH